MKRRSFLGRTIAALLAPLAMGGGAKAVPKESTRVVCRIDSGDATDADAGYSVWYCDNGMCRMEDA